MSGYQLASQCFEVLRLAGHASALRIENCPPTTEPLSKPQRFCDFIAKPTSDRLGLRP